MQGLRARLHVTHMTAAIHLATGLCCVLYLASTSCCISIYTGSPNVTSLTYNNRSRTLTCTSTGGPATTVTWRRNGVVITLNATHQQTKTLVDPVNGTYQTVLTIDSSVGLSGLVGNYNCTVENIRGTSSRSVFVGEPYFLSLLLAITHSCILGLGYVQFCCFTAIITMYVHVPTVGSQTSRFRVSL